MEDYMRSKVTVAALATVWLLGGLMTVQSSTAQELGDEFIFFVNGPNVLIPEIDPEVVNDPLDPTNKVAKFADADWSHTGFRWARDMGIDMTANAGGTGTGDTLYLRILSEPANAGQNISVIFTDKTDDSAASREDIEAGTATADHEFRAIWPFPAWLHDGQWHDLAIAMPPATLADLNAARDASALDSLATLWDYQGGWSNGGYGIGPTWGTDPATDLLWREFEWDAVKTFGIILDNAEAGGNIYYDDVYIANSRLDLSVASDPAGPMTAITVAADGGDNLVSWTHDAAFGGYNIYSSESAITDVTADGVSLLGSVAFNASAFEFRHTVEIPHPSLSPLPVYYAVTSLSQFGVENQDIAASAGSVENAGLAEAPFILELFPDEADTIFDNLSNGIASNEGFPNIAPFVANAANGFQEGGGPAPDNDTDLSAQFWVGYTDAPELFVYAEVLDDSIVLSPEAENGGTAWQWDSIEIGWGSYDVRDAGGSLLGGSPHQGYERESAPDYQFRFAGFQDATGALVRTETFSNTQFNGLEGPVVGGATVIELMDDGSGNTIGWKMLALMPLDAIAVDGTDDVVITPPASDELLLVPMNLAVNDADGAGNTRSHQILTTKRANADGNWWNTPAQWTTVAMVGRALAVNNELVSDVAEEFRLEANYPNPFSGETTFRFALPSPEDVTVEVYDILGRRVDRLIDNETMRAGVHRVTFDGTGLASGTYFYRIWAGDELVQTRQMMLIK